MAQTQAEINALMAEVNALASTAVEEIAAAHKASASTSGSGPSSRAPTSEAPARTGKDPSSPTHNLQRVLHLEVPVIVRLAERSMPLSEILNLTSGAIIEFDKSAEGELDLLINNKCIGHGLAVKVSENFGLRVTRIGSVQERIRAMGA